jgi:hypothetical protein
MYHPSAEMFFVLTETGIHLSFKTFDSIQGFLNGTGSEDGNFLYLSIPLIHEFSLLLLQRIVRITYMVCLFRDRVTYSVPQRIGQTARMCSTRHSEFTLSDKLHVFSEPLSS